MMPKKTPGGGSLHRQAGRCQLDGRDRMLACVTHHDRNRRDPAHYGSAEHTPVGALGVTAAQTNSQSCACGCVKRRVIAPGDGGDGSVSRETSHCR